MGYHVSCDRELAEFQVSKQDLSLDEDARQAVGATTIAIGAGGPSADRRPPHCERVIGPIPSNQATRSNRHPGGNDFRDQYRNHRMNSKSPIPQFRTVKAQVYFLRCPAKQGNLQERV